MKQNLFSGWLSSLTHGVASDILQMRGNLHTVFRIAVIVLFLAASVVTFDSCSKADIDDPELIEKPDTDKDGDEDGDNTGDEEDDPSGDEDGDNTGDEEDDPSGDEDGDNTGDKEDDPSGDEDGDKEDDTTRYYKYKKDDITYYYNGTEAFVDKVEVWSSGRTKFVILPSIETKSGRTIPVTRIGDGAFHVASCAYIESIEIPKSIISVGKEAFRGCASLSSIELPSVTSIGADTFYGCRSLDSVSLPLVTSIGESAFSGCSRNLKSIDLPLVTSVGDNAFSGCEKLTSVSLPLATSIGDNAFNGCAGLTSIELPLATSIGEYAFYECSGLISAKLPKVSIIPKAAFAGCSSLTSVEIPNNVTSIGSLAFASCAIESFKIPASVTSIGLKAFAESGLTSIDIPETVINIGEEAFYLCSNLTSCKVAAKEISYRSFYACGKLEKVEIQNTDSIACEAFGDCKNLKSVVLPATLKYIDSHSFTPNSYPDVVYCYAANPPTKYAADQWAVFLPLSVVHVPKGCKEAYEEANWGKEIIDDL